MKCINHPDRDAVANCQTCGKGLCQECAELIKPIPQCVPCFKNDLSAEKQEIIATLVKSSLPGIILMVLSIVGMFAGGEGINVMSIIIAPLFFLGIGFGWKALNRLTPNIFLFLPFIGWVIYFGLKIWLAWMIGIFVCPFMIYKSIKRMKEIDVQLQSV